MSSLEACHLREQVERLRSELERKTRALEQTLDVIKSHGLSHPMDIARWEADLAGTETEKRLEDHPFIDVYRQKLAKLLKEQGVKYCAQCMSPWHDGICECGKWGAEQKDVAQAAYRLMREGWKQNLPARKNWMDSMGDLVEQSGGLGGHGRKAVKKSKARYENFGYTDGGARIRFAPGALKRTGKENKT